MGALKLSQQAATISTLRSEIERRQARVAELEKDAARWRYARRYLDATDVIAWDDWDGHVPDESLSLMADAAIDEARAALEAPKA